MSSDNPIDLLFGGMDKLGPGSDADTLPDLKYHLVVDAECGSGRQTLALAGRLQTAVHAVDSCEPFLAVLVPRAREAGYRVLATHTLSPETWVKGYYDILESRAEVLLDHPDEAVRGFAADTLEEIRSFGCSDGSYGYLFYVMQQPDTANGPDAWRSR